MSRYWIGGSGNWADTAHWSTSSGGSGGAAVPTTSDDVIFDANSFSSNGTVTINSSINTASCSFAAIDQEIELDFSGGTPPFGTDWTVRGDLTLHADVTFTLAAIPVNLYMQPVGSATITLDSAEVDMEFQNGVRVHIGKTSTDTGTVALGSDLYTRLIWVRSSFDMNGYDVYVPEMNILTHSVSRTLTTNGSTIYFVLGTASTIIWVINTTNLTRDFTNTVFHIVGLNSNRTFQGSGETYGTLHNASTSSSYLTITGSNTFGTLSANPQARYKFGASTTQTITTFNMIGAPSFPIYLESSTSGTRFNLYKASGTIDARYLSIKDSNATGSASWIAVDSVDQGNNLGWTFSETVVGVMAVTTTLTATAVVNHYASITISSSFSIDAQAIAISQLTGSDRKEYVWKVYNSDDEFLGTWNDVISELRFSHELNNPGSSIEVELARNSDTVSVGLENLAASDGTLIHTSDAREIALHVETSNQVGPGTNVDLNHRVDVVVFYGSQESIQTTSGELIVTSGGEEILANIGSPNGKVLFTGYISRYISQYGNNENTKVTILSFGDELNNYIIEDAGDTRIPYATVDPSAIVRDVLDKYNGTIVYDSTSVEDTSTSVSYTFNLNTALEGVQKSLELAPQDWFWYVDLGTNILYFKDRPSTPSHYFMLGKHLESLDLEQNIEELVNLVYFQGGDTGSGDNLLKKYQDATSQSAYRLGLKRIADNRVTLAASAEIISEGEIERYKNPRYRSTITILSDVYDIESVQLGQIVGFRNFGNFVDSLTMQIVGRQYEPDRVVLQLDTLLPRVSKRLEDIYRNLNELDALNNPDAPT